MTLYLGIDIGTSGVRTTVIDSAAAPVAAAHIEMTAPVTIDGRPQQDAVTWWRAVGACLASQAGALSGRGPVTSSIRPAEWRPA